MRIKSIIFSYIMLSCMPLLANEGIVQFTPPQGWHFADVQSKMNNLRTMVVGPGQSNKLRPCITLGVEHQFKGTIKDYVKLAQALSTSHGAEFKDLGTIRTQAGEARLLQEDSDTTWGNLRTMHVILLKNETVYILTAGASKEEFPKYYSEFFRSMKSLRIEKDVLAGIGDSKRSAVLQDSIDQLKDAWIVWKGVWQKEENQLSDNARKEQLFQEQEFQEKHWMPFTLMLSQQYSDMGPEWKEIVLAQVRADLLAKG